MPFRPLEMSDTPIVESKADAERQARGTNGRGVCLQARDYALVPISLDHVTEQYQKWLLDEEVVQYLEVAWTDRSLSALQNYVENVIRDPNRYFYVIEDRYEALSIGTISLNVMPRHGTGHYGFLIGERDYWGTDAALQAQVAFLDFAFEGIRLRKVTGGVYLKNLKSHFLLRRLGFVKEGVHRAQVRLRADGSEVSDVVCYGLLAAEWTARREKFSQYRVSGLA